MTVVQSLAQIVVLPSLVSIPQSTTQQCTATGYDQFGNPLSAQPVFNWSVSGGGTINQSGLFTAPSSAGGSPTIMVTSGSYVGLSSLIIVATPASAGPWPATGNSKAVWVHGYSTSYVYTWTVVSTPSSAPIPTFSLNRSTSAHDTVVTYYEAGAYLLICNFGNADGSGTRYCSTVAFVVQQSTTTVSVTPGAATSVGNGLTQFNATAADQFGNPMSPEPAFSWSVAGGAGSVNSSGLYTASAASGTATVAAAAGSVSGTATVTVSNQPPAVATPAAVSPSPVTGIFASLSVLGADYGGEAGLTYTWATAGMPPAPVSFSANGTNSSKNVTATFGKSGAYNFTVTIRNTAGQSVTSSVSAVVNQTLTDIVVSPAAPSVEIGATQQLSALAYDQFGYVMGPQPAFTWTTGGGTVNSSGLFTAPAAPSTVNVTATSGTISGSAPVTVTSPVLDFSTGFVGATSKLTLNGSTALNGANLELTNSGMNEAGSAFSSNSVDVTRFRTWFEFQSTSGSATGDGFTFTIQAQGPTALGLSGGGLGYGADGYPTHPTSPVIGNSVAIKFDLATNAGEGPDSTGLYINGANPTIPATDLTSTGVDFHSGDVFRALISYDASTLGVTIYDTQTGGAPARATRSIFRKPSAPARPMSDLRAGPAARSAPRPSKAGSSHPILRSPILPPRSQRQPPHPLRP